MKKMILHLILCCQYCSSFGNSLKINMKIRKYLEKMKRIRWCKCQVVADEMIWLQLTCRRSKKYILPIKKKLTLSKEKKKVGCRCCKGQKDLSITNSGPELCGLGVMKQLIWPWPLTKFPIMQGKRVNFCAKMQNYWKD